MARVAGLKPKIKIAFASGTDELNARLIERMRAVFPELPLYVVAEFPPAEKDLHWVRYRGGLAENLARCRSAFKGKSIRLAGVLLVPDVPFRRMRLLALILAPFYFLAVNENLNDFMLRPGSLPAIARHFAWRVNNFVRWHLGKDGMLARRGWHDVPYVAARVAAFLRVRRRGDTLLAPEPFGAQGIPVSLDYLKFLGRTVSSPRIFRRYWVKAVKSLHADAARDPSARTLLWQSVAIALRGGAPRTLAFPEELFLVLTDGNSTVYPGKPTANKPRVLIVSAYLPFPLSHGGAVRIHNLTARAAADWDQILICFVETAAAPPPELLERFVEVVLIRRVGTHSTVRSNRPEVVEEFSSDAFRATLRLAVRKWSPVIAQLEFTHMAQYAADCAPARTILVEHDITFDLYEQMAQNSSDWDLHRELKRWRSFETSAWRDMSCVVTMSAKDQAVVTGARAVTLPNGVDLDRFHEAKREPEARRVLFVGSFSHLPNLIALAFFLDEVWPRLRDAKLHIIAGANHEYFLDYQSRQVQLRLDQPGIELEGFVADVRPAYERTAIVVAPLMASAGTNLKILEAMACGRPVVSTPAGVNGLDLTPGRDFVLVRTAAEMAAAITELFASPDECRRLAVAGRRRVEESYGWDEIARRQSELYCALI
jgi:glycosyltransferase involved in cell wall biosynthesis